MKETHIRFQQIVRNILHRFKNVWQIADEVARSKAVGSIEAELEELEYIFALLVQGTFVGMPSPPAQVCMDLLPMMENDLILLLERIDTANEPLSRLFAVFDIG